ncbi:hypothetical protein ASPWEDRAFT_173049 [Aspergillus wentii DTO 134E9]|uniref:Uncharacterized protein n=1 Tax=Aspergillus wentii DTO 134E9 TaxID=1073089 RepID=A0A1L9RMU7_ASPWE|nr:uncharacterized protein ASPWEDRAFT_173049 [Aspergillus wentii DTO 134E9]OJJ36265.1 hypothetical protein ASPWEDRAFT_173049 [Aspergillus wentii DTO 134E9]
MDQTLTYSEFMRRLDNKGLDDDMSQLSKEPKSASELNDAAQELLRNKYGGEIDPGKIDPELRGKKLNAPSNLDDPTPPRALPGLRMIPSELPTLWRTNGNNEKATEAINDRWDRIKNINQNIVTLRQEDTQSYIAKLFRKPTKNKGLGLRDDGSVKTTKEKSAIDIGPKYDKVDIDATLSANKDKLKAQGLGSKKELARWVNGLGNPESKAKNGYADA